MVASSEAGSISIGKLDERPFSGRAPLDRVKRFLEHCNSGGGGGEGGRQKAQKSVVTEYGFYEGKGFGVLVCPIFHCILTVEIFSNGSETPVCHFPRHKKV